MFNAILKSFLIILILFFVTGCSKIIKKLSLTQDSSTTVTENKISHSQDSVKSSTDDGNKVSEDSLQNEESSSNIIQYHDNTIKNINDKPITLKTSTGKYTIPAHGQQVIRLGDDKIITIASGNETKIYKVKENMVPKITLVNLLNGDNSVRSIQAKTGYRVNITDDFVDQLEYKITGPVICKEVKRSDEEIILEIKLNYINSNEAFERYKELHSGQNDYSVSFNINVKDKIAPHSVAQTGTFKFTKW